MGITIADLLLIPDDVFSKSPVLHSCLPEGCGPFCFSGVLKKIAYAQNGRDDENFN
ncbi:hypothetical protein MKMG_01694 [Methanogenium sp. MK-MG]|nr:hypothetical protein MKMG_01694 [Methanogenium sp. MK-MG]